MIFRQLFEPDSSTYTYLLGCPETGAAVLIDPVLETAERDLAAVHALGLRLAWTVQMHVHADHVTAAARLRSLSGCKIAYPDGEEIACADQGRPSSTAGEERERNCRLGGGRTADEFVAIMAALDLPYPRMIDLAVPANRGAGRLPKADRMALPYRCF